MAEAEIMTGSLLGAGQQASETIEPPVGHLHHPAPWWLAVGVSWWGQRGGLARLGRDVRRGAARHGGVPAGVVGIAPVQRH